MDDLLFLWVLVVRLTQDPLPLQCQGPVAESLFVTHICLRTIRRKKVSYPTLVFIGKLTA